MKNMLKSHRGIALVVALMLMTLILSLIGGGLIFSGINLKTTSHLQTGDTALHAADAGVQHTLAVIPLGGAFPYGTETTVLNDVSFGPGGYAYSTTVKNDPSSPGGNTRAIVTSTALGPDGAKKVVVAYIVRGSYGLGAVSLPESAAPFTETNFSGTSFSIDGNDYCHAASAVPGISLTDPALADEIANNTTTDGGLESSQMANVTGAGGSPSVATVPPLTITVDQIANIYLGLGPTVLPGGNYAANDVWGTSSSPRITHITGDATISGTIEGYGVLVVDGSLDIAGNFAYHGLVIARGDIGVQINGNAGVYGSMIIGASQQQDAGYELDIRGNAHVSYDSCALAAADGWAPLPKAAKVVAWRENF